jgi:hypothetical protein
MVPSVDVGILTACLLIRTPNFALILYVFRNCLALYQLQPALHWDIHENSSPDRDLVLILVLICDPDLDPTLQNEINTTLVLGRQKSREMILTRALIFIPARNPIRETDRVLQSDRIHEKEAESILCLLLLRNDSLNPSHLRLIQEIITK